MNAQAIDWMLFFRTLPPLFLALAWVLWIAFLLIPAFFGLHYADLFPAEENALFVLMGLVLCLAASIALLHCHVLRSVGFVMAVSILAYWF